METTIKWINKKISLPNNEREVLVSGFRIDDGKMVYFTGVLKYFNRLGKWASSSSIINFWAEMPDPIK